MEDTLEKEAPMPATALPDVVTNSREYFNEFLPGLIREKQDIKIGEINFTCMFRIQGENGGTWLLEIEDGKVKPLAPCDDFQAPCIIEMDDSTLMQVITGKVQPANAFFRGHIKLKGQIPMIIKLATLLPIYFRKHTLRAKK